MPTAWLLRAFLTCTGDRSSPIDFPQFRAAAAIAGVPGGEDQVYFRAFDLDSSGALDSQERWLALLDIDINGSLDTDDLAKWDANFDGKITLADLVARMDMLPRAFFAPTVEQLLAAMDKNGDGGVDAAEWVAWKPASASGPSVSVRATRTTPLSQQDIVSCGNSDQEGYRTPYCLVGPGGVRLRKYTQGCNGATLFNAAMYLHRYGLPTRDCTPYTSGGEESFESFFVSSQNAPVCERIAEEPCHRERTENRMSVPVRVRYNDYASVMKVIFESGPVMADLKVYTYFLTRYKPPIMNQVYPDGIYRVNRETEKVLGAHAVTIHGWGTSSDTGVHFLEGRNSWGAGWGNLGLFRILMHENHVVNEFMFSSADRNLKPHSADHQEAPSCIRMEQNGETKSCTFKNVCPASVRDFKYSYLGMEKNCGHWEARMPALFPGEDYTQSDALFCQVTHEREATAYTPFDPKKYFVDVSAEHAPYPCVLRNTWRGNSTRLLCCGASCVTGTFDRPMVFEETFCSDEACAASGVGEKLFEKAVSLADIQNVSHTNGIHCFVGAGGEVSSGLSCGMAL